MFNYENAFSRNIGWVTEEEQQRFREIKIAIAGMGGVGGEHLVTLLRMGIQHFHIADFDVFEEHNANRQAGAFKSTYLKPKSDTMRKIGLDINPNSVITNFIDGVQEENVDAFLSGVDIYVDSLDFFAIEARELVFRRCAEKNIPVITAAPLGLGTALLCFMPGKMDFDDYFNFSTCATKQDKLLKFLVGLSPSLLQKDYLVAPEKANFVDERGPSICPSIKLCAGVAATYVMKIALNRPGILAAPYGLHFDAYKNKMVKTYLPFGNKGLIQRLKFNIAKKLLIK